MEAFEKTTLWQTTLARQSDDPYSRSREKLRNAFLSARVNAEAVAAEIAVSVPNFTDHSIRHIDALWDAATVALGDEYRINPLEAFILGCTFLVHDLGMGGAVYGAQGSKIEDTEEYRRERARYCHTHPEAEEGEANRHAILQAIRLRHAEQAKKLATAPIGESDDKGYYIIEDLDLRLQYGALIGKIAASHWVDVDSLPELFPSVVGAIGDMPDCWTVNAIKIASILRIADVVQLDSRRAPVRTYVMRCPTGVSDQHWRSQLYLNRPYANGDRLVFTSSRPFGPEDADAWWLAFDLVKLASTEVISVDSLMADLNIPRFKIRSVAGSGDPLRFARFVQVEGWTPVDTLLKASDITNIISTLGGKSLYGDRPDLALRELLANASDASKVRKLHYGHEGLRVEIYLTPSVDGWELVVRDYGIGMGVSEIIDSLLDFGTSKWLDRIIDESSPHGERLNRTSTPSGKFGIGFFSVFMLGNYVRVRSRPYSGAMNETTILEFRNGLNARPVLRAAQRHEQLQYGGTEVLVRLEFEPKSKKGLFGVDVSKFDTDELLRHWVSEVATLYEFDIFICVGEGDLHRVVRGGEWREASPEDLFDLLYFRNRILDYSPEYKASLEAYRSIFTSNLQNIYSDEDELVGRAILAVGLEEEVSADLWWWPSPAAGVYVGGLYADSISDVMGAFVGDTVKADRLSAFPLATIESLQGWVARQAEVLAEGTFASLRGRLGAAQLVMGFGQKSPKLPIGLIREGEILSPDLLGWIRDREQVLMIPRWEINSYYDKGENFLFIDPSRGWRLDLPEDAILIDMYMRWLYPEEILEKPKYELFESHLQGGEVAWDPAHWWWNEHGSDSARIVLEAAAEAWGTDIVSLGLECERMRFLGDEGDKRLAIRSLEAGGEVRVEAWRIRRPSRPH